MIAYLRHHWRGELPLAVAWWINGVLVSILITALDLYIANTGVSEAIDSRARFTAMLLVAATLLVAVPVWQVGGIFRAADHHIERVGTILAGRLVQCGATLLILAIAVRVTIFAAETWQGVPMAYGIGGSAYHLNVMSGGQAVELKGGVSFGAAKALERVLSGNPNVRRIVLNSAGGSLSEARKLRAIILARQLDTDTTSGCSSACISAYIAGRHRYAHGNPPMGFHLPRNYGPRGTNLVSVDYVPELQYFASRGVPLWFIDRWVATGHRFWYPAPLQLRQAHIVETFVGGSAAGMASR